jgi:putative ATPase
VPSASTVLYDLTTSVRLLSPICSRLVPANNINEHLDASCNDSSIPAPTQSKPKLAPIFGSSAPSTPTSSLGTKRRVPESSQPAASSSSTHKKKRTTTTVSSRLQAAAPLAERLRPLSLDDFVGQSHLTGPNSLLISHSVRNSGTGSLIFWGPPG